MYSKSSYVIGIFFMAAIFAGIAFLFAMPTSQTASGQSLPSFAVSNPAVKEAYLFAVEHPNILDGVNCHCGCMQAVHNGRVHARGLLDCFRTPDGGFDSHGSQCDMCVRDALEAKRMWAEGRTMDEIKAAIDSKYA